MKHDVKPKIVHVLDDGTRLDSIEGFVIPEGHPFYTVWRNIVLAKRKEENERKEHDGCTLQAAD
jgi:hypothetical protein